MATEKKPATAKLNYNAKVGQFVRPASTFRNFVSSEAGARFPAEKDRYVLYTSPGCPWAHRTRIVRILKSLEEIIPLVQLAHMAGSPPSWVFDSEAVPGTDPVDPYYGFTSIRQLYAKADPGFDGRRTVPLLWDRKTETIVNNESSDIIKMFYSAFDSLLLLLLPSSPSLDLYPVDLRAGIDEAAGWVYETINNGVYRCGFATSQEAYDEAVSKLFAGLDRVEAELLSQSSPTDPASPAFLLGSHSPTDLDVRLYPTIARFDVAYNTIMGCNLRDIRHGYPKLHLWLRRLYWDGKDGWDGKEEKGIDGLKSRGAFYRTTEPWLGRGEYAKGYTQARRKVVGAEPGVVWRGPEVGVLPLGEGELGLLSA